MDYFGKNFWTLITGFHSRILRKVGHWPLYFNKLPKWLLGSTWVQCLDSSLVKRFSLRCGRYLCGMWDGVCVCACVCTCVHTHLEMDRRGLKSRQFCPGIYRKKQELQVVPAEQSQFQKFLDSGKGEKKPRVTLTACLLCISYCAFIFSLMILKRIPHAKPCVRCWDYKGKRPFSFGRRPQILITQRNMH